MSARLRDNGWLESRLRHLWDQYYFDAPIGYPIEAKFGRPARYRYGSICNVGRKCRILVNGLFAHPDVPEFVVDATLAHELAHYVHGYGSGLPKLHSHPHRGGVIDKEMAKRGCLFLEEQAGPWRRDNWQTFYESQAGELLARQTEAQRKRDGAWTAYLSQDGFRSEDSLRRRFRQLSALFGLETPPYDVSWLLASPRRTGLSYRFRGENSVKLHATLADKRVPDEVIDYELCYWLAAEKAGGSWPAIERAFKDAGLWARAEKAIRWRRRSWPAYRQKNLPV